MHTMTPKSPIEKFGHALWLLMKTGQRSDLTRSWVKQQAQRIARAEGFIETESFEADCLAYLGLLGAGYTLNAE